MSLSSPAAPRALFELVVQGSLPKRLTEQEVFETLSNLSSTRLTARGRELVPQPGRQLALEGVLTKLWPEWREVRDELVRRGFPPSRSGLKSLDAARRLELAPQFPPFTNQRVLAAYLAGNSKLSLSDSCLGALECTKTHDGAVRLRTCGPLYLDSPGVELVDTSEILKLTQEISLPERAFLQGLTVSGDLSAVITVENLGAWADMPLLDGWLVAYVPGNNTSVLPHLFKALPDIPKIHFGDLDPKGWAIFQRIAELSADVAWFVPGFWAEELGSAHYSKEWPPDIISESLPPLVQKLAADSLWLEQERIVLDSRLPAAMEACIANLR